METLIDFKYLRNARSFEPGPIFHHGHDLLKGPLLELIESNYLTLVGFPLLVLGSSLWHVIGTFSLAGGKKVYDFGARGDFVQMKMEI